MTNVFKTFTEKLKKIDSDMKNKAVVAIKIGTKRKLTPGEIAMSRLVFKDSIDYAKVWIHLGGLVHTKTGNAMTPAGEIYISAKDYEQNPDFSVSRPNLKHWFIHEMTHVWQYQMGVSTGWLGIKQLCNGGYTSTVNSADSGDELKAYDTDLMGRDINKKFQDFNFEQQGRIIEFYFDGTFLKNEEPHRKHLKISKSLQGKVLNILKDFLINPKNKLMLPKG
ncbi:zinc protease [Acinetobacter faecalis]|uniref:zinc protease n=1 Tax=Acinetobacter faecalis TaxID=2665161 RepID=UPI002A9134C2|nr:zinc protease [Acinetobacter faecalis]MDY6450007.1 zinc protease [Acinetobacter faecalis]MDY6456496.1 zinc protease [Acinetobacter faecalis]